MLSVAKTTDTESTDCTSSSVELSEVDHQTFFFFFFSCPVVVELPSARQVLVSEQGRDRP